MSAYTMQAGSPPPEYAHKKILVAAQIAIRYRETPSAAQLIKDFGMSPATAFRWRAAFKIARGEK